MSPGAKPTPPPELPAPHAQQASLTVSRPAVVHTNISAPLSDAAVAAREMESHLKPAVLLNSGVPPTSRGQGDIKQSQAPREPVAKPCISAAVDLEKESGGSRAVPSCTASEVQTQDDASPKPQEKTPRKLILPPFNGGFKLGSGPGPRLCPQPATEARAIPSADALLLPFTEYKPVEHACWEAGKATPYLHLARAFQVRIS